MKLPFFSSPAEAPRAGSAAGFAPLDLPPDNTASAESAPAKARNEPAFGAQQFEQDTQAYAHDAVVTSPPPAGTVGAILVSAGRLTVDQAHRIASEQLRADAPFGETAIRLGLARSADIQFALAQQFSLPCLKIGDPGVEPEVVAAFQPTHEVSERMRGLRSQIAARTIEGTAPHRSVAVLGLEPGIGKSFIAANLATVFAQLGARTLLIDADLSAPRLHTLFHTPNRVGLSSILAGRATLAAVREIPGLPGLHLLPAGPQPPNPDDLIARSTLAELLRLCERDYDIVLLDTPAWTAGHSAHAIANAAEAAILLISEGHSLANDAAKLAHELAQRGTRLLGVVLNRPK